MTKFIVIKRILRIILLIYIGLGFVLYFFQNSFIYYPDQTDFNNCENFSLAEKVTFGLTRMYVTNRSTDKAIVFYHGNAGRACDRDYLDSIFASRGYSTIFVEYAGYADTNKKTTYSAVLKNVSDTVDFLKTKKFSEIVVSGESLGNGPAAYQASISKVDKLILITSYNNFSSVVSSHYPIYPIKLLLRNNYTPDIWLANYHGKVSFILAGNDEVVPNKLGQKLYNNLNTKEKNLTIIQGVGHNTIYESDEFYSSLLKAL